MLWESKKDAHVSRLECISTADLAMNILLSQVSLYVLKLVHRPPSTMPSCLDAFRGPRVTKLLAEVNAQPTSALCEASIQREIQDSAEQLPQACDLKWRVISAVRDRKYEDYQDILDEGKNILGLEFVCNGESAAAYIMPSSHMHPSLDIRPTSDLIQKLRGTILSMYENHWVQEVRDALQRYIEDGTIQLLDYQMITKREWNGRADLSTRNTAYASSNAVFEAPDTTTSHLRRLK